MHYAMNSDPETQMMDADSTETFMLDKPSTARDFLSAARRLVDQGEPSQALQAVFSISSRFLFHLRNFPYFCIQTFFFQLFYIYTVLLWCSFCYLWTLELGFVGICGLSHRIEIKYYLEVKFIFSHKDEQLVFGGLCIA